MKKNERVSELLSGRKYCRKKDDGYLIYDNQIRFSILQQYLSFVIVLLLLIIDCPVVTGWRNECLKTTCVKKAAPL